MNSGDTAFVIVCAALVLFMTPGLAFFYGGLVRRKNVVNTLMSCLTVMGIVTVLWCTVGYSLSFSEGNGFIGCLDWALFNGIGMNDPSPYAGGIPHYVFIAFQMMFAIITPALMIGSVVGRMKFKAIFFIVLIWMFLVYFPICHMVWGKGGFLNELGVVDFAGGFVVHISSAVSGLVLAIILGRRKGYTTVRYNVHNIPFVVLGAGMLWFGWLGFNAGSSLAADGLAAHAFMTSCISAGAGMMSWIIIDVIKTGKPTLVGASTGLVVGLASVTQGSGFVPIWAAFIIGAAAGPVCYFGVKLIKNRFNIDDSLDVFGCHGLGGIWGCIATGLFAQTAINGSAQLNGLVFGETGLFSAQMAGMGITIALAVAGTLAAAGIVRIFMKLRVTDMEEREGLDKSQHGEKAYPSFNGFDD